MKEVNMFEIREESVSEYGETENVVREAFWNVYSPGCAEHYLLHRIRKSPAFIPQLNLVAVENGNIIGQVINVKSHIQGDNGSRYEVLTLGPIAVLPPYQGKGIGAKLITETKKIAGKMGFRSILLCGNPDYYTKQGFEAAEKYGIRNSENMFADALHVYGLYEGALNNLSGIYYENNIYQVNPDAVNEFDKSFPPKIPLSGTPSQQSFLEIAARCRRI